MQPRKDLNALRGAMAEAAPGVLAAEFTGHSCRRGGAQFILRINAQLKDIMATGRWSSSAVMAYFAGSKYEGCLASKLISCPAHDGAGRS